MDMKRIVIRVTTDWRDILQKAGKSMVLNALMGQMILPPDDEAKDSHTTAILNIATVLASTASPSRRPDSPRITLSGPTIPCCLKGASEYGQMMQT